MVQRYVKLGQIGKSMMFEEGTTPVPAFETDGIVSFVSGSTIIISPTATIIGTCWKYAAYYNEANFVKWISNGGDLSGWSLDFYIAGSKVAEVGMSGMEIAGIFNESSFVVEDTMPVSTSKQGELEYSIPNAEWWFGVPNGDQATDPFVKVATLDASGNFKVYEINERGVHYSSAESPLFVGVPYGWTPPFDTAEGYLDLTSDMNHTAMRLERIDVGGVMNAKFYTKVVSEGVSF